LPFFDRVAATWATLQVASDVHDGFQAVSRDNHNAKGSDIDTNAQQKMSNMRGKGAGETKVRWIGTNKEVTQQGTSIPHSTRPMSSNELQAELSNFIGGKKLKMSDGVRRGGGEGTPDSEQ
jgi:hypothetical protein